MLSTEQKGKADGQPTKMYQSQPSHRQAEWPEIKAQESTYFNGTIEVHLGFKQQMNSII